MINTLDYKDTTKSLDMFDKFILLLYGGYFILTPFYLWSSGLPQLADFILVLALILYFLKFRFKLMMEKSSKRIMILLVIFLMWVAIINLVWTVLLSYNLFRPILYYLFNIIIAIGSISLLSNYKERLLQVINKSIIISLVIQFLYFITSGGVGLGRTTLSFNNPNQLGYFGILSAALLIIISNKLKKRSNNLIIGLLISFLLVLVSLSNASIISYLLLVFLYIFSNQTSIKSKRKLIIITSIIMFLVIYIYNNSFIIQENIFFQSLVNRLSQTSEKVDSSLYVRGYDRIVNYPQYLIFGAGEGQNYRFSSSGLELHSTLGNIQFSYGLIGTLLFSGIIFKALYQDKFKHWYLIVSIFIYGLTHNGLRNSMLWIIIALLTTNYSIENKSIN